jgi:glycosyltransferase involved in cell wall biosynthesis
VKAACETAAIAVVPSKWAEPFGRTALEAHAGGAALISSGTGGLREASGEHAVYLPAVTEEAIAAALKALIEAPEQTEEMARKGMERAQETFSTELQAAKLDDFLVSISGNA